MFLFLILASCLTPQSGLAKTPAITTPGVGFITAERSINALTKEENNLYYIANLSSSLIKQIYFPDKNKSDDQLPLIETSRVAFTDFMKLSHIQNVSWRGVFTVTRKVYLFDGWHPSFLELGELKELFKKEATGKEKISENFKLHFLPRDLIKPTSDRIGPPTSFEIAALRKEFGRRIAEVKNAPRFTGITHILNHKKSEDLEFLLVSRMPGFTIVRVTCKEMGVSSCMISERCRVTNLPKNELTFLNGIAFSAKRNQLVVGSAKKNMHVLNFQSCSNISYERTIKLEDKSKVISNVAVDSDDQLWVSFFEPNFSDDSSLKLYKNW